MGNAFLRVMAWMAVLPYLAIAWLVVSGVATWSAVAYVVALGVLLGGLATLPQDGEPPRRRRGLSRLGAGAVLAVAIARLVTAGRGHTLELTQNGEGSGRLVARLIDESDLSVAAMRTLYGSGMLHDDAERVPTAMRAGYEAMRREEGDLPTPQVATLLGLQRPSAFDLLVFDAPAPGGPERPGVVFLHGSAGNFDLPCWQVAKAVRPLGAVTVCPSTVWSGWWANDDGEAIVRRSVEVLRARGATQIVLMGLSNGGIGASLLAPRMKGLFVGMVLFSGADPAAASPGVPTLVIHGTKDSHVPAEDGELYAANTGARYVGVDAGHFAMLVRAAEVDPLVRAFVADHASGGRVASP